MLFNITQHPEEKIGFDLDTNNFFIIHATI